MKNKIDVKMLLAVLASSLCSIVFVYILSMYPLLLEDTTIFGCIRNKGLSGLIFGKKLFLFFCLLSAVLLYIGFAIRRIKKGEPDEKVALIVSAIVGILASSLRSWNYFNNPIIIDNFQYIVWYVLSTIVLFFYSLCAYYIAQALADKYDDLKYISNLRNNFYSLYFNYKYSFYSAIIFGLVAYGFLITNKIPNHDDLSYLFAHGADIDSRRWGLFLLGYIIPDYSMPWLNGILTIFVLAISCTIIAEMFSFKNKYIQILLSGTIIVLPSQICIMFYTFTTLQYSIALLLAVFSVKYAKDNKNIKAVILAVLSTSIYQTYICVISSLMLVLLISKIFDENDFKKIIKDGIRFLVMLVVATTIYYLISSLFLALSAVEMNSYSSDFVSGETSIIDRIMYLIFYMYRTVKYGSEMLWCDLSIITHIIVIGLSIIAGVLNVNSSKKRALMIIISLVLLPLSINGVGIIVDPRVHIMTKYGFFVVYCFASIIYLKASKLLSKRIIMLCLSLICLSNIYYSNILSLNQYFIFENAKTLFSSVMTMVQEQPYFEENSEIAIIGTVPSSDSRSSVNNIKVIANQDIKNRSSRENIIRYYLGYNVQSASDEARCNIIKSDEFRNMPSYPENGFISEIDGIIVVKFSDVSIDDND